MKLCPSSRFPFVCLVEVADFHAGSTLPDGEEFCGQHDGFLHLKVSELNDPSNTPRIVRSKSWSLDRGRGIVAPPDSVVIPKRGGAIGTNKKRLLTRPAVLDPNLMAISAQERLNHLYLYRWFYTFDLVNITSGSIVPQLNKRDLAPLEIPLPPLPEQKRIARILDAADALRAKRRESLDQLDTLLQSTFLDMFGDPVTNPMGWATRPLGELAENRDSLRVPVKKSDRDRRSGPYPYYGSVGVIDDIDDYLFEGEHLLISEDGKHLETRNRPITCLASGRFWVNNHAHVLASNGEADLTYLAHYLELCPIRQYVTGIDQLKLNRKNLDIIPTPEPPLDLQHRFTSIVESIEQQKTSQRTHLTELDTLFGSLQSRAFSGDL